MFNGKHEPQHIIRTPAYPWVLDEAGFVRAGHVLKLIDIGASEAALAHLNQKGPNGLVVTAMLDRTDFHAPIRLWEMIRLDSRVTRVWRSSMEAQVRVRAENILNGASREIATAYLVFVALDPKTRKTIQIPPHRPRTCEDDLLAKAADLRKANRVEEGRTAPMIPIDDDTDNPVVIRKEMTPNDANAQSNVFGGVILSIIDEAGNAAAKTQALSGHVVGVRQDRMSFLAPTFIGETVEAKAVITKTWRTSMEAQVEVEAVNPVTGQRRQVASSYLVYVRLGTNDRPAEVPPFTPATELQNKRAEGAGKRREIREHEANEADDLSCTPMSGDFWRFWLARLTGKR